MLVTTQRKTISSVRHNDTRDISIALHHYETLTISIARHHNETLTISIARHDAARNSLLRPSKCNEARNSRFVNSADRELKHSQGVVEVGEQCDFQPFLLSFYLLLLLLFREKSQPRFIFT